MLVTTKHNNTIVFNNVLNIVNLLKPSKRNELEITDVNNAYLKTNSLSFHIMEQGSVWMDAGTERSLLQASLYVQTVQDRQNIQIASPEGVNRSSSPPGLNHK